MAPATASSNLPRPTLFSSLFARVGLVMLRRMNPRARLHLALSGRLQKRAAVGTAARRLVGLLSPLAKKRYLAPAATTVTGGIVGGAAHDQWARSLGDEYAGSKLLSVAAGALAGAPIGTRAGRRTLGLSRQRYTPSKAVPGLYEAREAVAPIRSAAALTAVPALVAPIASQTLTAEKRPLVESIKGLARVADDTADDLVAGEDKGHSLVELVADRVVGKAKNTLVPSVKKVVSENAGPVGEALRQVGGGAIGSTAGGLLGYLLSGLATKQTKPTELMTQDEYNASERKKRLIRFIGAVLGTVGGYAAGSYLGPRVSGPATTDTSGSTPKTT